MLNVILSIGLVATSFTLAFLALYFFALLDAKRRKSLRRSAKSDEAAIVFLFEDEHLVDASPAARQFLTTGPRRDASSDWAHLESLIRARFPTFSDQMSELAELGQITIDSQDATRRITAEWRNGLARVEVMDRKTSEDSTVIDRLSLDAMQHELEALRATAEHVPLMVWKEDSEGTITWANRTYLDNAAPAGSADTIASWPPAQLFERQHLAEVTAPNAPRRMAVQLPSDGERHWFELHDAHIGKETLFTAIPVDRVVHAEQSQSEFVTTLTKTFAHLPIGLVIFDRNRQLSLFNPALTDLVNLPIEFLVGKPALISFLDQLREKRMIPEPKDYISWRQQMSDLEAAAVNGTYEETWALPSGQTFRVSGRPHPDGAVAFLFEDISSEVSLTRRFRSELELGQSALDSLSDAIAVFSAGGVLSISNRAYDDLWGSSPSTTLQDLNLGDAISTWKKLSLETQVWQRLKEYVASHENRTAWNAVVALNDGRTLDCQFQPLARGSTIAQFRIAEPTQRPVLVERPPQPANL